MHSHCVTCILVDTNKLSPWSDYYAKIKILKVKAGSGSYSLHPFPFTEHIDNCAVGVYTYTVKDKGGAAYKVTKMTTE